MRYDEVTEIPPDTYRFTTIPCPHCGNQSVIDVNGDELRNWKKGHLMQVAFVSLTDSEREMLMTGICGKCWDEIWGE